MYKNRLHVAFVFSLSRIQMPICRFALTYVDKKSIRIISKSRINACIRTWMSSIVSRPAKNIDYKRTIITLSVTFPL